MNNSKKPWRSSAMDIPEEIIHDEILMRLPVMSLLRFRCVCKAWRDLIGNPRFIDSHLNHPSQKTRTDYLLLKRHVDSDGFTTLSFIGKDDFQEDDDRVNFLEHGKIEIGGPCNGIFLLGETFSLPDPETFSSDCFGDINESPIYFCNPATREIWKIPDRPEWCGYDCNWMTHSLGFGFDYCSNQYKIVSILSDTFKIQTSGFFTSIYHSGSNSWMLASRKIMPTVNVEGIVGPLNLNKAHYTNAGYLLDGCGLYFDGFLHWRMAIYGAREEIVLSFDLTTEELFDISLPRGIGGASEGLLVLEDCLALAVRGRRTVPCSIEIWVMGEYGIRESWTKRFCVGPFEEIPRFLACRNGDTVLFETLEGELASCNLGKDAGQLKRHGIRGKIDVKKDIHLGAIVMQKEGLVQLF